MTIDDKIEKTLDNLWHESEVNVMEEAFLAAVAAIPKIGGSINSLLTGRAKRLVVQRAIEVFNAIKERVEQVDEGKIDREFFESEEFQVLFALVLAQLQSTHD